MTSQASAPSASPADPENSGDGALVIVGTPIGNLSDASPRLLEILRTADVLAVEDTRTLHRLAAGLGVNVTGRVVTHHEHNETARTAELLDEVRRGKTVAVLSDAGMPTVSDPGFPLVRAAAQAGLPVTVLPGPSAVLAALAVSGLPTDRFTFEGFLARKKGERAAQLAALATEQRTMVFYESPHRLADMLIALREAMGGDRRAAVCRELTKLHEEVLRDDLDGLVAWATQNQVRGEIVVVLHGAAPAVAPDPEDLTAAVEELVATSDIKLKAAARQVATEHGVSTRRLYDAVIAARAEG
ncbi:ribosomal RNA small subunit methyltransferase I [Kocuria varians]|uniref:Ribosomal RNA small subunit methyltransferase I n=1 Tax=Kocuria varians TaxID=1272 RepID=A0A4Y4D6A3_KOCVA|nr:16S rRNA (cytidine(1402)-2'-O)-methyltransferase [Kocuria varians]GEC98310.1 ribosomal RNA small subunit methyltransferase I [Kocuria varians]